MSETLPAPAFTAPALQRIQDFGALETITNLMLEGRSAEVLCVVGGLASGYVELGTAEDDSALLDELERHIWARIEQETPAAMRYLEAYILHPVMVNVMEALDEGAAFERLWGLVTGLMIGAKNPYPRLHGMIMINRLSKEIEDAKARETASPN